MAEQETNLGIELTAAHNETARVTGLLHEVSLAHHITIPVLLYSRKYGNVLLKAMRNTKKK